MSLLAWKTRKFIEKTKNVTAKIVVSYVAPFVILVAVLGVVAYFIKYIYDNAAYIFSTFLNFGLVAVAFLALALCGAILIKMLTSCD